MRLALTALLVALSAAPALAQQVSPMTGTTAGPPTSASPAAPAPASPPAPARAHRTRQTMQQRFDAANTTRDGKLTLDQAKAGHMTQVAKDFDAIDTGRKGYVTMDDIRAHARARRAASKAAR